MQFLLVFSISSTLSSTIASLFVLLLFPPVSFSLETFIKYVLVVPDSAITSILHSEVLLISIFPIPFTIDLLSSGLAVISISFVLASTFTVYSINCLSKFGNIVHPFTSKFFK